MVSDIYIYKTKHFFIFNFLKKNIVIKNVLNNYLEIIKCKF